MYPKSIIKSMYMYTALAAAMSGNAFSVPREDSFRVRSGVTGSPKKLKRKKKGNYFTFHK